MAVKDRVERLAVKGGDEMGDASIRITVEGMDAGTLEQSLRADAKGAAKISYTTAALEPERAGSSDVLVAIIESGTTVFTALMAQLFTLAQSRKSGRIIIYTRSGRRIEQPAGQTIEMDDDLPAAEDIALIQVAGQESGG